MASDALMTLANNVTATTSGNGSWFDLKTTPGTPRRGMDVRVDITAHSATTPAAGQTIQFRIEQSADATNVYGSVQQSDPFEPGGSNQNPPEISLPFIASQRYVRLAWTYTNTAGTPSTTFTSQFETGHPA